MSQKPVTHIIELHLYIILLAELTNSQFTKLIYCHFHLF